ncbi:hypothetical protein ACOMHN_019033 [Nucella lapillus]
MDHIATHFQTPQVDVVVGLAPYEIQAIWTMMAQLYQRTHLTTNTYTLGEQGNEYAFSLMPSFSQMAEVVNQLLRRLQWQGVYLLVSEGGLWRDVGTQCHIHLSHQGFRLHRLTTLPSGANATVVEAILRQVPASFKDMITVF